MLKLRKSAVRWARRSLGLTAALPKGARPGIIVSYPNSGRTWLRLMLANLGTPLDYVHDGINRSPQPLEQIRLCAREVYREKPVVFLLRDPRDTVVSGYFQKSLRLDEYGGSLSDFLRDPLHGVERVIRYHLIWLERGAELPAFLPVTYEALVADTAMGLRGIVDFLGIDLHGADLDRVVAEYTFEKMRERQAQGTISHANRSKLLPTNPSNPESYKTRRGKPGGYVDYFSAGDLSYCEEMFARHRYFETCQALMLRQVALDA